MLGWVVEKRATHSSKLGLVSSSGRIPAMDALLEELAQQNHALLSVVGKDCALLEDIMDECCVGNGSDPSWTVTTSHPDASVEEVIEFARNWSSDDQGEVRVIEA